MSVNPAAQQGAGSAHAASSHAPTIRLGSVQQLLSPHRYICELHFSEASAGISEMAQLYDCPSQAHGPNVQCVMASLKLRAVPHAPHVQCVMTTLKCAVPHAPYVQRVMTTLK